MVNYRNDAACFQDDSSQKEVVPMGRISTEAKSLFARCAVRFKGVRFLRAGAEPRRGGER